MTSKGESLIPEAGVADLAAWESFYVIVGSAAAVLTGLMFVVITLIADVRVSAPSEAFEAFNTPNVFHFGVALLVAALLTAPWPALWMTGSLVFTASPGILPFHTHNLFRSPVFRSYLSRLDSMDAFSG